MFELPQKITFQWHITNKCNRRCLHCYQEEFNDFDIDLNSQIQILENIEKFESILKTKSPGIKFHFNITGGEPFLNASLFPILEEIKKKKMGSVGILSNGFLVDEVALNKLKDLNIKFIQLSLEGNKKINNQIRGENAFEDTILAAKKYNKLKIPLILSFTANSKNYNLFPEVVKFAMKYKFEKVWTDRYIPFHINDELEMSTDQVTSFFKIINNEQEKFINKHFTKTNISSSRSLQFLTCGGAPYKCSAGYSLLCIMPNGDIFPCRRLPIKIGNILEQNLNEIYFENQTTRDLRDSNLLNSNCKECYYNKTCFGGLKCLSYVKTEKFHSKDPNCWINN